MAIIYINLRHVLLTYYSYDPAPDSTDIMMSNVECGTSDIPNDNAEHILRCHFLLPPASECNHGMDMAIRCSKYNISMCSLTLKNGGSMNIGLMRMSI